VAEVKRIRVKEIGPIPFKWVETPIIRIWWRKPVWEAWNEIGIVATDCWWPFPTWRCVRRPYDFERDLAPGELE